MARGRPPGGAKALETTADVACCLGRGQDVGSTYPPEKLDNWANSSCWEAGLADRLPNLGPLEACGPFQQAHFRCPHVERTEALGLPFGRHRAIQRDHLRCAAQGTMDHHIAVASLHGNSLHHAIVSACTSCFCFFLSQGGREGIAFPSSQLAPGESRGARRGHSFPFFGPTC